MMRTWRQVAPPSLTWAVRIAGQGRPGRGPLRSGWRGGVEPVELCALRYGYAPLRFRHRGGLRLVRRVERSWEVGGQAPRRYFALRCADGEGYTLFQDLRAGTWHAQV